MNDYASIVCVMFRTGLNNRGEVVKKTIPSILEHTLYPYELILIDNSYNNRGLAKARNDGIKQATGKYIVLMDDDILFTGDWLTRCVELIEKGDKYMATPVVQSGIRRWEMSPVDGYRQNYRTGSNCMVMRRTALDDVGLFDESRMVGNLGGNYADRITKKGYTFLITEIGLARDLAFRKHSYGV